MRGLVITAVAWGIVIGSGHLSHVQLTNPCCQVWLCSGRAVSMRNSNKAHLQLGVQVCQAGVFGVQLSLPRLGTLLLRRQRRVHLGAQPRPRGGSLFALGL